PGFVSLFNGKDLTGWELSYGWEVRDGVLAYRGTKRSHLFTTRNDFRDFHFKAEVRIPLNGNSGVWFWSQPGDEYPTGYEVDLITGEPLFVGSVLRFDPSGWGEASHNPRDRGLKADEWFPIEVIVKDRRIKTVINGHTVIDGPLLGTFENRGRFALQSNDG